MWFGCFLHERIVVMKKTIVVISMMFGWWASGYGMHQVYQKGKLLEFNRYEVSQRAKRATPQPVVERVQEPRVSDQAKNILANFEDNQSMTGSDIKKILSAIKEEPVLLEVVNGIIRNLKDFKLKDENTPPWHYAKNIGAIGFFISDKEFFLKRNNIVDQIIPAFLSILSFENVSIGIKTRVINFFPQLIKNYSEALQSSGALNALKDAMCVLLEKQLLVVMQPLEEKQQLQEQQFISNIFWGLVNLLSDKNLVIQDPDGRIKNVALKFVQNDADLHLTKPDPEYLLGFGSRDLYDVERKLDGQDGVVFNISRAGLKLLMLLFDKKLIAQDNDGSIRNVALSLMDEKHYNDFITLPEHIDFHERMPKQFSYLNGTLMLLMLFENKLLLPFPKDKNNVLKEALLRAARLSYFPTKQNALKLILIALENGIITDDNDHRIKAIVSELSADKYIDKWVAELLEKIQDKLEEFLPQKEQQIQRHEREVKRNEQQLDEYLRTIKPLVFLNQENYTKMMSFALQDSVFKNARLQEKALNLIDQLLSKDCPLGEKNITDAEKDKIKSIALEVETSDDKKFSVLGTIIAKEWIKNDADGKIKQAIVVGLLDTRIKDKSNVLQALAMLLMHKYVVASGNGPLIDALCANVTKGDARAFLYIDMMLSNDLHKDLNAAHYQNIQDKVLFGIANNPSAECLRIINFMLDPKFDPKARFKFNDKERIIAQNIQKIYDADRSIAHDEAQKIIDKLFDVTIQLIISKEGYSKKENPDKKTAQEFIGKLKDIEKNRAGMDMQTFFPQKAEALKMIETLKNLNELKSKDKIFGYDLNALAIYFSRSSSWLYYINQKSK